jgi:hypothetical protein
MKRKVLRNVAHNFGHSFVSLLNYHGDDHVMSWLVREALFTGEPELRFDVLTGHAPPSRLLLPPVEASIDRYVSWFPRLLETHRLTIDIVARAELRLRFDLARYTESAVERTAELPFDCWVTITDDQETERIGHVRDWWYLSRDLPLRDRIRLWWWRRRLRREAAA